jgi:uncharacterized protein YdhG (YjbR/CyaY superfamily)
VESNWFTLLLTKNILDFTLKQMDKKYLKKIFWLTKTSGKGTIQFPLDKSMPLNLITKIVKFRVKENLEKVKTRLPKRTTNR